MKIIYHACPDGYITEVVLPLRSEIFGTMESAQKRVENLLMFRSDIDIKDISQEYLEHTCSRVELIKQKGWDKKNDD